METAESLYHPSESSEDSDGAKEAKGSSRKALDAFLACRDVSPVRDQLLTSGGSIARKTQHYHIRKARQVVIAALEETTLGNAEILLNKLVISNDVAQTEDQVATRMRATGAHEGKSYPLLLTKLAIERYRVGFLV